MKCKCPLCGSETRIIIKQESSDRINYILQCTNVKCSFHMDHDKPVNIQYTYFKVRQATLNV